MAKMFYTAAEAAEKLNTTEEVVKTWVAEGKLREFRDAGTFNYKVSEVDLLVRNLNPFAGLLDSDCDSSDTALRQGVLERQTILNLM